MNRDKNRFSVHTSERSLPVKIRPTNEEHASSRKQIRQLDLTLVILLKKTAQRNSRIFSQSSHVCRL